LSYKASLLLYGWIILYHVYIPCFLYMFIHQWARRLTDTAIMNSGATINSCATVSLLFVNFDFLGYIPKSSIITGKSMPIHNL
jgi:hypothetical protein